KLRREAPIGVAREGAGVPDILRVAVPVPLPQLFDYLPPPGRSAQSIPPRRRVLVPFGRGRRVGGVVASAAEALVDRAQLKPVLELLDPTPLLTTESLRTLEFTARYYQHALGEVLQTALPVGLRSARAAIEAGEPALALCPQPS